MIFRLLILLLVFNFSHASYLETDNLLFPEVEIRPVLLLILKSSNREKLFKKIRTASSLYDFGGVTLNNILEAYKDTYTISPRLAEESKKGYVQDVLDLVLAASVTSNLRVMDFILENRYEWIRTVSKRMQRNVLHYAFAMGDVRMIELIIKKLRKEDYWMLCKMDTGITTPAFLSLAMGHSKPIEYFLEKVNASILPFKQKDAKGRNLFHVSVIMDQFKLAEKLMIKFPELAKDNSVVTGYYVGQYVDDQLPPKLLSLFRKVPHLVEKFYLNENGSCAGLDSTFPFGYFYVEVAGYGPAVGNFDFVKRMIRHKCIRFADILKKRKIDLVMVLEENSQTELGYPSPEPLLTANLLVMSIIANATEYSIDLMKIYPDLILFKDDVLDRSTFFFAVMMNNQAIIRGFFELCPAEHRWILTSPNAIRVTPFHYAIEQKYFEVATMFLEYGLTERDPMGWTYRHLTAYYMRFSDSNDEIGPMNYSPCHFGAPLELLGGKYSLSVLGKTAIETQLMIFGGQMESMAMKEPDDDDEKEEDSQQRLQNKKKKKNKKKK